MSNEWRWLESTKELQEKHFNVDYDKFTFDSEELVSYLMTQFIALQDELFECLKEISWKPWSKDDFGVRDRNAAVSELIDAEHFLANMYVVLGVTDHEHDSRYRRKQERNASRQKHDNYTLDVYKCRSCKRELDKPGAVTPINQYINGSYTNKYERPDDAPIPTVYRYRCVACCHQIESLVPICLKCGAITSPLIKPDGSEFCDECHESLS